MTHNVKLQMFVGRQWGRLRAEPNWGCRGPPLIMSKRTKAQIIAARLERVPWWRNALKRLGARKNRRHEETLDLLAGRDVTDTISEADVNAWLSMLESQSERRPRNRTDS